MVLQLKDHRLDPHSRCVFLQLWINTKIIPIWNVHTGNMALFINLWLACHECSCSKCSSVARDWLRTVFLLFIFFIFFISACFEENAPDPPCFYEFCCDSLNPPSSLSLQKHYKSILWSMWTLLKPAVRDVCLPSLAARVITQKLSMCWWRHSSCLSHKQRCWWPTQSIIFGCIIIFWTKPQIKWKSSQILSWSIPTITSQNWYCLKGWIEKCIKVISYSTYLWVSTPKSWPWLMWHACFRLVSKGT